MPWWYFLLFTDTHQTDDYVRDTTFKTVRQMGPRDEDDIDLTPSGIDLTPPDEFEPPSERLTIYANTLELNTNGSAIYANSLENGASLFANTSDHTSALTTSYEDPEKFAAQGIYDDPNITLDSAPPQALGRPLPQAQNMGGRPLPQVQNMGGRPLPQAQNMGGRPLPQAQNMGGRPLPQAQNMGGRPLPQAQDVGGRPPTGRPLPQNANSEGNRPVPTPRSRAKMEPSPTAVRKEFSPTVQKVPSPTLVQSGPKFDDTIYAKRVDSPGGISSGGIEISPVLAGQQLKKMVYFHGTISRVEAEAMLERDGDFLVRESGKQPGQYVLTGMGGGKLQHLLLIDKQGKVRVMIGWDDDQGGSG